MPSKQSIARYREWYARLLRLYPKPFRKRFEEGMAQTFHDLCRERKKTGKGLFAFTLRVFVETSAGIVRERMTSMLTQNKRVVGLVAAVAILLLIPLVAMQFTAEVNWSPIDFVVMGGLLLGVGLAYELVVRRSEKTAYRVAFGVGLLAVFLLFWVNGAVGIIGNEGQPANLLYGAVVAVGVIGSLLARFKPSGMAVTLFAAALTQLLVPVISLLIWPDLSWGAAGMFGVFYFNGFFVLLFVISGFLFRRAGVAGS